MKLSTRLALAISVIVLIVFFVEPGALDLGGNEAVINGLAILLGTWAVKFIVGSFIDTTAEPND